MRHNLTMTAEPSQDVETGLAKARAALVWTIESAAALLVAVETVILFSGVVARYIFQHPLDWSDELGSLLFLWLAMLGAVIAFWRGNHMRMTVLVDRASPTLRAMLDVFAIAAALVFLLLIVQPTWSYANDAIDVTSPALQISTVWRAAALPVGAVLLVISSVIQLAQVAKRRTVLLAIMGVALLAGALYALQPVFENLGNVNLVIFFVVIVAIGIFSGVPIAFTFGIATFAYLALTTSVPLTVVVGRMEMTGIAAALVNFLAQALVPVRGGLSYALVGAMYLLSGISGSKVADMAAVAPVLFPEMKRRGSDPGELVALLAATGAQTETIPPGIVLITIGSVTGVSITALFTGGLMPAIALGLALCAVVWYRHRKHAPDTVGRIDVRRLLKTFVIALPALALPVVIRGAVVEGVATATEVSTVGVMYSLIAGLLIYRKFEWRRMRPMMILTAALSGSILLIIGTATAMAWALTQSGFSIELAAAMAALPGGAPTFLAVSVVAFIVLGSVLEGIPAVVLFGPLLFPIARTMGISEVHYAIVVVLSMGIGLFAPPFGVGYYSACVIGGVDPSSAMRKIWPYLAALLVGIAVVTAVPWFSVGFL
jgi:tripartite ATP-independent transporter DctM subunit